MQVVYEIANDSIFDAPRLINAIGGVVVCTLLLFVIIVHFKDFGSYKNALGIIFFILFISIFQFFGMISEWDDYKNNYYLALYLTEQCEIVEGEVNFYELHEGSLSFMVNNVNFDVISNGYNNRGFHREDYKGDFKKGDYLKIYFFNKIDNIEPYRNYADKVIMKIEKTGDD